MAAFTRPIATDDGRPPKRKGMPHLKLPRGSLRMRVVLIPFCILLLGMLAATGLNLLAARSRIGNESKSGITVGSLLIGYALERLAETPNADETFTRLRSELAQVRHIQVRYEPLSSQTRVQHFERNREGQDAPEWFQHLFEGPKVVKNFPVVIDGVARGTLVMSTRPADEVAEVWSGLVFLLELLGVISIAIVTLLYLTARFTLKPLHELADGLDRLEHGQFDALAEIKVAELHRIGEKFNDLARSLARTQDDNRLLIDRLMSVQDAERKELARELHDEFGASLFGIRAAASCIVEDASQKPAEARAEIIEQAHVISSLADTIQKHNYRILDRIRPVVLHQMGLMDAVRQLVETWSTANRNIACTLKLPPDADTSERLIDEAASLTCYRIIQECLTNAARHSKAKSVSVSVALTKAPVPQVTIDVEDDGTGLPPDFRFGFGFLGMSERARKLGGRLEIGKGTCGGTLIRALIPFDKAANTAGMQTSAPASI
jgi:two-component system sensor histidine kinase UhpB